MTPGTNQVTCHPHQTRDKQTSPSSSIHSPQPRQHSSNTLPSFAYHKQQQTNTVRITGETFDDFWSKLLPTHKMVKFSTRAQLLPPLALQHSAQISRGAEMLEMLGLGWCCAVIGWWPSSGMPSPPIGWLLGRHTGKVAWFPQTISDTRDAT